MKFKDKFFLHIDRMDKIVGTAALVAILILVFYQVISRYWLGTSLRWSEELSRYIMLYMIMIGLGAGIKRRKHLGVDTLAEMLPARIHRWVALLAGVLTTCVYLVMMYYSWRITHGTWRSGQVSPAAGYPMVLVYVSMPLGFLIGALRQLDEIGNLWKKRKEA